jgi:hypothetical protein
VNEITYLGRSQLRPERRARPAKVTLSRGAQVDLDQAELFLLSLDTEMLTADGPRTAYLLGLAEGHVANLVQRLREVSE